MNTADESERVLALMALLELIDGAAEIPGGVERDRVGPINPASADKVRIRFTMFVPGPKYDAWLDRMRTGTNALLLSLIGAAHDRELAVSRAIEEAERSMLAWMQDAKDYPVPAEVREIKDRISGLIGQKITEMQRLPKYDVWAQMSVDRGNVRRRRGAFPSRQPDYWICGNCTDNARRCVPYGGAGFCPQCGHALTPIFDYRDR